jgi:hypothetical protein
MQNSWASEGRETAADAREAFSDFALRIAGPADGQLEASIDGAPYKPCRYADGYWWYCWSGTLEGSHHMVVVVRTSAEERSPRA